MDAAIREHVGIVFQESVLDRKLTVEENLMIRGSFYGYTKKEVRERLQKFWEFFELKRYLEAALRKAFRRPKTPGRCRK